MIKCKVYITFILFLFLQIANNIHCQEVQQFIFDPIQQNTIPYANIYIKNGKYGWISDKNGAFIYDRTKIDPTDVVVISALGYQKKTIPFFLIQDSNLITLSQRPITLREAEIKSRRYSSATLGKKGKVNNKVTPLLQENNTDNIPSEAIFIANTMGAEGILDKLKIFIKKGSNKPFKIILYDCNLIDGTPRNKLLESDLYIKEDDDRNWISIDIKKENILIPKKGFFVAIDWNIDSIYLNDKTTLWLKDSNHTDNVILGEHFVEDINRWRYTDEGWENIYKEVRGIKNEKYLTLAIHSEILYDKSAIKEHQDIFFELGIADKKTATKTVQKYLGTVKQDIIRYPQGCVNELIESIQKAVENNDTSYLISHLFYLKYDELQLMVEGKFSLRDYYLPLLKKFFEYYNSPSESLQLIEIEPYYYAYETEDYLVNLFLTENKWKISPNIIKKGQ